MRRIDDETLDTIKRAGAVGTLAYTGLKIFTIVRKNVRDKKQEELMNKRYEEEREDRRVDREFKLAMIELMKAMASFADNNEEDEEEES